MNLFKISALAILFFVVSLSGYAQKAKIETNGKSVITSIVAVGANEIFTEIGTFKFSDISEIFFEKYDPSFETTFAKLQLKVSVKYGDGSDLGGKTMALESQPEELAAKNKSSNYQDDPEDYLIKASRSALVGIGLTVVGGILAAVGGGEEISYAGGALGLIGFGLTIDAWSKIGKAGRAMKAERQNKK
jgi:hypothetical protein